jgi:tetrahydromethanopterin S-methyltransferase subunit F
MTAVGYFCIGIAAGLVVAIIIWVVVNLWLDFKEKKGGFS